MKFEFKNLGVLDKAEIEIKDLTILCGKNNTGKTYLTYALYGFLKYGKDFLRINLPENEINTLKKNGSLEIDLYKTYLKGLNEHLGKAVERYASNLDDIMGAGEERFKETKINIELSISDKLFSAPYSLSYSSAEKSIFTCSKAENSPQLKITALIENKQKDGFLFSEQFINEIIKEAIWDIVFPHPFIISSERTGAVMFRSELNLAKNKLIQLAHQMKGDERLSPVKLLNSFFERGESFKTGYPRPVTDNVEFINSLSTFENRISPLLKEHPTIIENFESIIGGTYKSSKEGDVRYIAKDRKQKLTMNESSSAVRSLVMLGYYIRHAAKIGDILIIDEPELNLHPENQRKIARLIARLVNAGIKVIVTTHSDYFVKEISTLIMLSNNIPETENIKKKYNYHDLEPILMNKVSLYVTDESLIQLEEGKKRIRANILKKADIDPIYGIEARTFDETINLMNKIQSDLLDSFNK